VERNYGATNCIHGFNKEKERVFFFVNEDAHLCCSLRDSQDLITNNNKENNGFLGSSF
jgi:hypothetical protein